MAIDIPDKLWSWVPVVGPLRTMVIKTYEGEPVTLEDHIANITGGATTVISDVTSNATGVPKSTLWLLLAIALVIILLVVI